MNPDLDDFTPAKPAFEEYPALTEETKKALTIDSVLSFQSAPSRLTFSGRPCAEAKDPHSRLCQFLWELVDQGDPEVLGRLKHHQIEFQEADGTKVFPRD